MIIRICNRCHFKLAAGAALCRTCGSRNYYEAEEKEKWIGCFQSTGSSLALNFATIWAALTQFAKSKFLPSKVDAVNLAPAPVVEPVVIDSGTDARNSFGLKNAKETRPID